MAALTTARITRSLFGWSALGGLALCAALAGGCGDEERASGAPAGGSRLPGTRWTLDVSALGVRDADSVASWIAFERGDRVSGNDGCNQFSGSYRADGSKLTFGRLASTQMACGSPADEVSRAVTAALARVRTYEQAADTLRMGDAGGETLLTYAAQAAGIEGDWSVLSVLYDDAIRSVEPGTELTAAFSPDGTISGETGCNGFHGPYTLAGDKLDVGPLTATKKACPTKAASRQEAGYLAALESAVRIEQAGPQLRLLNGKGQMAVTLARG
jgi:heat shock protein HslJ